MPYKTPGHVSSFHDESMRNSVIGIVVFVLYWGLIIIASLLNSAVSEKTYQVDPCDDAIFQRTLSFKLNDWEVRARKKLGDQWSCYEIGQTERFTLYGEFGQTLKVRIVFVLKKNDEVMK